MADEETRRAAEEFVDDTLRQAFREGTARIDYDPERGFVVRLLPLVPLLDPKHAEAPPEVAA